MCDETELVEPGFCCPKCGERDMDKLIWVDPEEGDLVVCQTCGHEYNPGAES